MDIERLKPLRQHRLLATLDEAQFERVARASETLALAAGQMLFQRGGEARRFYIVLEGQVRLSLQSRAGDEKTVEVLGVGEAFAEALMFAEVPLFPVTATATAVGISTVLAIPNADYLAILRASTPTCLRLLADLSRRLHVHIREIEALALENAANRLVSHLVALSGREQGPATVTLEQSKQALATRLGIKPETLSRTLRALSEAGLITVEGRLIHVPDLARLKAGA